MFSNVVRTELQIVKYVQAWPLAQLVSLAFLKVLILVRVQSIVLMKSEPQ